MLDIKNREDLFKRLADLRKDAIPVFGKMTPQHMVEHLAFVLRISSEKLPHQLYYSEEKASKIKAYTIYTDNELMVGFRAPMLASEPPDLGETDLPTAIEQLMKELDDFDAFFERNKNARPTNPTMGPLDHEEWIIFHNKHVTHHFKQFNLA
ncbi:MAG TPA: DinB family protein [Puia sp.]|nr:DinB family protein [Puia sp.]